MDRRVLLTGLGSTVATATIGGRVFSQAKDVPPELAGHYKEQFATHVARHGQLGARPLLGTAISEYGSVKEAASVAPPALKSELDGMAVAYANLVGWLFQDLGDFGRSWHWRSTALELAHRSNDTNLVAYALTEMALLRRDIGDGQAAVDLTTQALATPDLPHTVRSFALRQAAHAYSLVGDRDAMDGSLGEAAAAAELVHERGADDRYSWFPSSWWGGTQHGNRAVCLMRLGDMVEAAELLSQTLEVIPDEARRYRGITSARLASTLVELEGPSAALDPASEAVDCFNRVGSSFLERELADLQQRARKRATSRDGWELVDVLRVVA